VLKKPREATLPLPLLVTHSNVAWVAKKTATGCENPGKYLQISFRTYAIVKKFHIRDLKKLPQNIDILGPHVGVDGL
jgi:hypothetical protein